MASSCERPAEVSSDTRRGELIATILAGAWCCPASSPALTAEELAAIAPLLLKTGGAALGWWRVRASDLRSTPVARELQQAYRLHTLQAALKEREISGLISYLRAQGLEPLMGKGWAIAKQYPEPGLRPYGDMDLYVRPREYDAYAAALKQPAAHGWDVDLHRGAAELDDRSFDQLYAHSQRTRLNEVEVRIFGPEDHLRLLCLHLLREGALRPLWLCDIAVSLSKLPPDFDWDYCLSGDRRRSDWVACAIGLAHQLLGADVEGLPVAQRAKQLPAWLAATVLEQWGAGRTVNGRRQPMAAYLPWPGGVLEALRLRWPNPIEATLTVWGEFNEQPRLPYQLGACVVRTGRFIGRISGILD